MQIGTRNRITALLLVALVAVLLPGAAQAAGTASNTTITNTATVNYQVGGVSQTAVTGSTSFVVDNKVNLTVTKLADATVVPGSANQTTSFSVTNNGNTAQRYALSVVSRVTDSFDMSNVRIYRDVNTNNVYDAGTDTLYVDASTFGDVAADGVLRVLIVADTPGGQTNGQTAVYDLVATTVDAGTTNVTAQTGGGNTAGVDVAFADAAGSAAGDVARDGKHSSFATYTVSAASVSVNKGAVVYSDPFNGISNPKAIPSAVITYTVTVTNAAGGAQATNVTITDTLPGNITFKTQFDDGAPSCGGGLGIVVNNACNGNGTGDGDNADWNVTTPNTITVVVPAINAGTTATIKYQVTVN